MPIMVCVKGPITEQLCLARPSLQLFGTVVTSSLRTFRFQLSPFGLVLLLLLVDLRLRHCDNLFGEREEFFKRRRRVLFMFRCHALPPGHFHSRPRFSTALIFLCSPFASSKCKITCLASPKALSWAFNFGLRIDTNSCSI